MARKRNKRELFLNEHLKSHQSGNEIDEFIRFKLKV